jgi:hypothetical protein
MISLLCTTYIRGMKHNVQFNQRITKSTSVLFYFKGTVSRDFPPLVFSSNNPIWAPDSQVKAILNMASNSRSFSTKSVAQRTPLWPTQRCQ